MKKIGIIATLLTLMLVLIGSASANDTPTITSTPVQTAIEDQAYTYDVEATDPNSGDVLTYSLTTKPDGMTINSATGVITWTPNQADATAGTRNVAVKVEDNGSPVKSATQSFLITITAVNDAPVLTISDCISETNAVEDVEYTCTVTATDEDDTALTFSLVSPPEGMAISTTGVITWTPNDEQIGSHTITVKVEDNEIPTKASDQEQFTVFVRPQDVCGDLTGSTDLDIDEIDITDDDEDFYPGRSIEMEISLENNADDDLEDIVAEAVLYDTTDGKTLESVKTEGFDINEDESESVELTMDVPASLEIGHDIVLFISAYEDGNDDENCDWESNNDLDFARKTHDVSIIDMILTPETAKSGQTVELKVDIENVGDRDEEDIYIKVKNSGLLVDKKSEPFSIDSYESGDDDEYTTTLTFTIPTSAKAGEYDMEVYVYNENGKRFESGFETVKLTVEPSGTTTTTTTTTTGSATITVEGLPEEVKLGKPLSIPIQITNTASETKEYTITVSNIKEWADSTSEIDAYLTAGQTSTYYITITPKTDAVEGKHSATINIKEGSATVTTKTLSFTVPETSTTPITGGTVADINKDSKSVFNNLPGGTILWVVGDLVLVVLAVLLMKMLFSKKEE